MKNFIKTYNPIGETDISSAAPNSEYIELALPIPTSTSLSPTATINPTHTSKVTTPWTTSLKKPIFHPFTGQSAAGLHVPTPDNPSESFQLFFTPDLIERIVEQSNLYAEEVMDEEKFEKWNLITTKDLQAYFGFCILMGINSLPSIEDYWEKNPVYHYPPIADRISRERFREISRYLHFVDNATLAPRASP